MWTASGGEILKRVNAICSSGRKSARQYFDPVAARVREVDRPAAAAVSNLIGLGLPWVCPVRYPAFANTREHGVELGIGDREGVVLGCTLFSGVGEIERRATGKPNRMEPTPGAHRARRRQSKHLGKKSSGSTLVAAPDDQVVEVDRHASSVARG